jgi:Cys-tRNA(Pro)/Cys-tRNA(Cys) deacylase
LADQLETFLHPHVRSELERSGVAYTVRRHADMPISIHSPADFAQALGYPIERITKSLLVRCQRQPLFGVVVCPASAKVQWPLIAGQLGCKRAELATAADLQAQLGYPPTGVSPVGVGATPVLMDERLLAYPTILIGAGVVGVEIEIAPADLRTVTQAVVLALTL